MKKVITYLLVFLFVLAPVSSFAAGALTLNVSVKEVKRGGEITISGKVPAGSGDVVIKIVTPIQTVMYIDVLPPLEEEYSTKIEIPTNEDLAPSGIYTVTAGSGSTLQTKTFTVTAGNGSSPDPDLPSDGGNSNPGNNGSSPAPSAPDDSMTIAPGAGRLNGAIIVPDMTGDGRYIVGADTLARAAQQAGTSVTIELPATTAESAARLELPAESLTMLKEKELELIISTEDRTIQFPAGSIQLSEESGSIVRVVVNSAWTEEAKLMVEKSLQGNPEYSSSQVVLSVVIQIVSAEGVREVHQLNKPAIVKFKLTTEQEKAISRDLAGVYYVDGNKPEYTKGTLSNGVFTFTAEHFSYYAILEYTKTFIDMNGHWAEEAVKALAAKQIVTGVDERHYEPNRSITRAEFVSLLMRALENEESSARFTPTSSGAKPFNDVPVNQYYTERVNKAAALGLVKGHDGKFRPDDSISREEAVAVLVRAAEVLELREMNSETKKEFADSQSIAAWAQEAVEKAWSLGIIVGDGNRFNPKNSVTRAEMAVMIYRMLIDRS
ncbi:S-layer homology domain-containing protein [Neobacillus mesonae]|nr:S-layer homology domain-containing protein [Neobacillus mesonae]